MNAAPTTPSTAATLQGATPSRKGESAAADTPFSRILSGEIAQQIAADACEPRCGKDLANRLSKLLDEPSDPMAAVDPSLTFPAPTDTALPAPAETAIPAPAAETLLWMGLPFTLPAQNAPGVPTGTQVDAAPAPDAVAPRDLPANVALRASTEPGAAPASSANANAGTGVPSNDSEPASGLFGARLAAEGARTAETPPELVTAVAMRPAAAPAAADTGPAPTLAAAPRLAPEVGSSAWGHALGEKIVWMASGGQQSASLTLNPPNLGPLQVVLEVANDQATANFFAAQPEVRQALEAALPRLREMMGEAGIQLGQANVSADTPSQHSASDQHSTRTSPHEMASAEPDQPVAIPATHVGRGLVDTFA